MNDNGCSRGDAAGRKLCLRRVLERDFGNSNDTVHFVLVNNINVAFIVNNVEAKRPAEQLHDSCEMGDDYGACFRTWSYPDILDARL